MLCICPGEKEYGNGEFDRIKLSFLYIIQTGGCF